MRVVYTSDLHADLGPRSTAFLEQVAIRAAQLAPDVFVVAGDVAETAAEVTRSLRRLARVGGLHLYLAGNHDLFVDSDDALRSGETSLDKHERLLPEAAARAGFGYLGLEPARVGGLAIVGVCGWYDFSMRDPRLDGCVHPEHYRSGQWRGLRAFDRGRFFWPRTAGLAPPPGAHPAGMPGDWAGDEEVCDWMLSRLDRQAATLGEETRAVLAVVHVLPFLPLVQRGVFSATPFHDAYLGSTRLGERLRREPRLRAVICGHLHRVADVDVEGVRVVARPVGGAAQSPLSVETSARERVGCLDIEI